MRFVSKSSGLDLCFKREVVQRFGPGEEQIVQPLWNCHFRNVEITKDEIAFGKSWAVQNGTQLEEDSVTPANIDYRYGVFDTRMFQDQHRDDIFERTPNGFTDEHREELEAFLLGRQDEYYRVVPVVVLAAPWPNYDSFKGVRGMPTAQRIAERVKEDGYDLDTVLAYERANRNRQDVLDAVEALRHVEPVEETDDSLLVSA